MPPPRKKGGALRKLVGIGGGVIVAVIVAIIIAVVRGVLSDDATAEAKQGDCIADLPQNVQAGEEANADNAKVVECGSAEAKYTVVGRVDGVTAEQASGDSKVCDPYVKAGAEMMFYAIPPGGKGYVLCLKPA